MLGMVKPPQVVYIYFFWSLSNLISVALIGAFVS